MAATTALMQSAAPPPQPPPASSTSSSDSMASTAVATALECDDSDSSTGSDPNDDHRRRQLLKRSRSPDNEEEEEDEDASDREEEIDDDRQPPRVIVDSSTEEETTVDETMPQAEPVTTGATTTTPVTNNDGDDEEKSSSMATSSSQLLNLSNGHSSGRHSVKNRSTGKLERITQRLAKRQNGGLIPSENAASGSGSGETKSNSAVPAAAVSFAAAAANDRDMSADNSTSDSVKGDSAKSAQADDATMDDDDEEEDEDVDEEEDEEIKNGFRALGLMGNVAFMGDESFKCPVCGVKLDSQHTFTLHIRSHNPNDHSNSCSLCGKTLSSASSLDRHMLIHSGERPFKCSLCGMAFTTNGNMHRHMRTHGHGSIGYTPRGQKRRAKLLTQALEKAVAAAAAGEQVDLEAINKLKKSILESKVTPMPSGSSKRGQKSQQQTPSFSEQLLSSMAPNVSIEAAAAAAVAAASNKSKCSSLTGAGPGSASPLTSLFNNHSKDNTHEAKKATTSNHRSPAATSSTSHYRPLETPTVSTTTTESSPSPQPSSLASSSSLLKSSGGIGPARWSAPAAASTPTGVDSLTKRLLQQQPQMPEKGRPGRKKKPRLLLPAGAFGVPPPPPPPPPPPLPPSAPAHPPMPPAAANSSPLASILARNGAGGVPYTNGGLPKPPGTRCPICGQPTRNTTELHVHMMAFHMQEKLFCNDCGMILDNYDTYTQHHCTASAATVMSALAQNPSLRSDLLFCSSNTSRMNFSSARTYAANLEMLRGLQASSHLMNGPVPPPPAPPGMAGGRPQTDPFGPQSLMDLTRRSSSGKSAVCSGCNRKFSNAKQLRQHQETFCHQCNLECDSVSTYQLHQFSHSFERFGGGQPGGGQLNDKMQLLKNAAAFSLLPPQPPATTALSLLRSGPPPGAPARTKMEAPRPSSPLSHSSMASLTSMANMKPDLADIESILSIVHGGTTTVAKNQNGGGSKNSNQLRSPISPNRASDAGEMVANRLASMNGGEAGTRQPESPASADSAAGAVASSNMPAGAPSQQHSTRTDLDNGGHGEQALCLSSKPKVGTARNQEPSVEPKTEVAKSPTTTATPPGDGSKPAVDVPATNRSRYRCESCRLSFKSMNALRRHNRGHTAGGGHSHACHLCPYKSLDKSTLIRHLRTHNGERPFQCAICKYAFTTKANCERHVRKRHKNLKSKSEIRSAMQYNRDMAATAAATRLVSEKIFIERDQLPSSQDTICKKCLMDFGTNRELRAHLRIPNNPCSQQLKPFVCTICNIGFNTRNNCVRHIIKQHPATIEVSDEDAAKVVADAESLMIETGSSSPASNGPMSSSFSGLSSASSEMLSECDSYGTYDDEPNQPPAKSAAASAQRQQPDGKIKPPMGSPLNLSKRLADHDDDDDEESDYGEFDDESELIGETGNGGGQPPVILDLSCKSK